MKMPPAKKKEEKKVLKAQLTIKDIISIVKGSARIIGRIICQMGLQLKGFFRIGLGDPFETGMMMGTYYAVLGFAPCLRITIVPSFIKKDFSGRASLSG